MLVVESGAIVDLVCAHTVTQSRGCGSGSWCCACGVKVYAVDERECQHCASHKRLWDGSICRRHLMRVAPAMHVTYKISEGSCFEPMTV